MNIYEIFQNGKDQLSHQFENLEKSVNSASTYLSNVAAEPLDFVIKRIPNSKEIFTNSIMQGIIDTLLGDVKKAFGSNPTAGTVFRDASKIPSTSANIYGNNTIGSTGTKYSKGNLYSVESKVVCKTVGLMAHSLIPMFNSEVSFEKAARSLNGICEYPAIVIKNAARDQQDAKKTEQDFWEFFEANAKWGSAFFETIVKFISSDSAGEYVKKLGYSAVMKNSFKSIDQTVQSKLFPSNKIDLGDSIYSKISAYATTTTQEFSGAFAMCMAAKGNERAIIFNIPVITICMLPKTINIAAKFAIGVSETSISHVTSLVSTSIVDTIILTTITKTATDATGVAYDLAKEPATKVYEWAKDHYEHFNYSKTLDIVSEEFVAACEWTKDQYGNLVSYLGHNTTDEF